MTSYHKKSPEWIFFRYQNQDQQEFDLINACKKFLVVIKVWKKNNWRYNYFPRH